MRITVEASFRIEFLTRKQIWRAFGSRIFLLERLAEWEVFELLEDFAVEIGDVARASQVIWVEEVLVVLNRDLTTSAAFRVRSVVVREIFDVIRDGPAKVRSGSRSDQSSSG